MLVTQALKFSLANSIIAVVGALIVFVSIAAEDAEVRPTIWLLAVSVTFTGLLQIVLHWLANRNRLTYSRYSIAQFFSALLGAIGWGMVKYSFGAEPNGFLEEISLPIYTYSNLVVAVWLAPVPLISTMWLTVTTVLFLLLGINPDDVVWYFISPFWCVMSILITFSLYFSLLQRIVSRLQLEEQQRENALLLEQFENFSTDFLWRTDTHGRLTYASRRMLELSGRANIDDHPYLWELFEQELPERQLLQSRLVGNRSFSRIRVRVQHPEEAKALWFGLTGHPIRDAGRDDGDGFHGVGSNITEEVELEKNRSAAQTSAAISQMASTLAHDFNNYLATISGSLELIRGGNAEETQKVRHYANVGLMTVQKASELSRNLLSVGMSDVLDPSPVRVEDCVQAVVNGLEALYGDRITISIDCPRNATVYADTGQFQRALRNVMQNAAQAMAGKGHITVTAEVKPAKGNADRQYEHFCHITIEDTGPGFEQVVLASAVRIFTTTKHMSGGTGIGLAMVNGFCQQSGGDCLIRNSDKGAIVEMVLPHVGVDLIRDELDAPKSMDISGLRGKQVLLVEDEEAFGAILAETLTENGLLVEQCASLNTSRRAIRDLSHIDLLLSDIVLGDGYGHELGLTLLRRFPEAGIVYMSGYMEEATELRAKLDGPVLLKPFSHTQLLNTLAREVKTREILPL